MSIYRYYILWMSTFVLLGCSSLKRTTVNISSGLLYDISFEFQKEIDWHHLKDSMPGTLKMIEGLRSISPHNENLTAALVKGYAGYAFAVWETLALDDILSGKKKSQSLERALQFYARAIKFGLEFFAAKGLDFKSLQMAMGKERGIAALLDSKFDRDDRADREATLYFALSLGSLIHLQKTNIALMAQLPIAKKMFDWVCQDNPGSHYGTCGIFYGSYEAGIPKMLGGSPERGKKVFEQLIKENGANWLARVAYIQYYAIPMADRRVYLEQSKVLETASLIMERKKNGFQEKNGMPLLRRKT